MEATAVAYGEPAMRLLDERVRAAKAGDPLAPVTVVVPSNYAAVAARRALARRRGGVANVTFLTLHRLAERLGAKRLAAAGRRPVSPPVLAAAVRGVLHDERTVFDPVAEHPATEQALVASHRELAAAPDAALDPVAACSARAADVVRIHRTVTDRLAGGWHDEQDLLVAATAVLRSGGGGHLGPVLLFVLQDITAAGAELLRTLAGAGSVEAIVGVTGDDGADRPVLDAHARAGIVPPDDHGVQVGCAARIVSTSDPDEEVRAAVQKVASWMHDGVALGRIALLYGLPDPYLRLLHEHLAAAGIPVNGAPVTAVADQLVGRTLRALLALPDRGYRRTDVLAVLTGAPLLDGDGRVPGRAWERVSREAGVVGGNDWEARLATLATELRARVEAAKQDERDSYAAHLCRDADRTEDLARFVQRLRADVDAGRGLGTWADLARWAKGLVETYLGDERRRVRWPEDERLAAERVDAALDRLGGLDALGGPPPDVETFRRTLDGELDAAVRRVGRLGEGVLVGHVSMATGLVLDRVAVLGMAEGSFPPRRLEDSLLPDDERAAAGGELPLRADRVQHDRRHLLTAVAVADEAVLCQPRGDLRRSGERPASRWLLADAATLAGVPGIRSEDLADHAASDWLEVVPSFAGGLEQLSAPATEQELRLAAVARGLADDPALDDDLLQAASHVVGERRSDRFTRFDGNLSHVAGPELVEGRFSATRLQTWAACPQAYLVQYVLGVEPVEEPERRIEIDALDRGSLVHEILERFVEEALDSGHPLDGWGPPDADRMRRIADACFASYVAEGRTGRDLLWRRDKGQIWADLERFLEEDGDRLRAGHRPLRTEHPFRDLPVALPSGREIRVGGFVDRIDEAPDGSLCVLDYKTGSTRGYEKLSEGDPHLRGTKLQLYLYARAAEAELPRDRTTWAGYWFASSKGKFSWTGYPVTPAVATEVEAAIDAITAGIAAGVFPARPSEQPAWKWVDCWYCTPDGLSAADRRRDWERKRDDPALEGYVGLAEGVPDDGG